MKYPVLTTFRCNRAIIVLAYVLVGLVMTSGLQAQERTITALPYTVTTADNGYTLRLANSHMTTGGQAITFDRNVHDVVLELGTDTITWGTDGNANTRGIWLANNNVYNITIRGGYVLHDPPASATVPSNLMACQAVRFGGGVHDILLDSIYFSVYGRNSQIMLNQSGGDPGAYNIEIYRCVFDAHMESFTSREMWIDAAMLALGNNDYKDGAGFQYHYKVHGNTTINAHWCNLYLHGRNLVAEVYDNYLIADARNDLGSGFPTSAAQCYALTFRGGGGGSRVDCYNNTIRSGTAYGGCRGVFISGIDGEGLDEDNSVYLHDNDILVHQGHDGEEQTVNGILIRQGWSNIILRNNHVTCVGDTDEGTSSYGVGPMSALRLTGYGSGLRVIGNTLVSYYNGSFTPNYSVNGPFGAAIMLDEYQMNIPDVVIDSNIIETDDLGIRWGFFNGHGGNITLRDNIYQYRGGLGNYVFYLGYGAGASHHAYGNVDLNGFFLGGASPTHIFTADSEPDSLSISLEATLLVTVNGNNAMPVANTEVWVTNGYGDQVGYGTTNSDGLFSSDVCYRFESNDTFSGGDSTSYNSFFIKVKKASDSSSTSHTVSHTSRSVTLTLSNTAGEEGSGDIVSPAPILDIGAVCDSASNGAMLTWTATGDDGRVGQADRYDIRYSQNPINEGNFSSAHIIADPPTPRPTGQSESFVVTFAQNYDIYYLSIKAYDESSNGSPLDDPTEYAPGNIRAPTLDTVYVDENNHIATLFANTTHACEEIHYEFQISTESDHGSTASVIDSNPDTYARASFNDLLDNTVYYWRCRAVYPDSSSASDFSENQAFMPFVTFAAGCDDVELVSPTNAQSVSGSQPTFTVSNVNEVSQNQYFFELDDDSQFDDLLANGVVVQQAGEFTTWTVPISLQGDQIYYWRARVNNCGNSQAWNFTIAVDADGSGSFAYPNPIHPGDGDQATFSEVPANSELSIMTVSGDLVKYWTNTDGEDILWDGTNSSGNPVSSGIYLWFVSPSGSSGKLVVVR